VIQYKTCRQEAQLPQRNSASASHVFLCSLTDRALHWAPHLFYNYNVQVRSRSFKVDDLGTNRKCVCDFLL